MDGLKNAIDGKTVSVAPGRDETVTVDDKRVSARDQHLSSREATKKNIKKVFEDRYTSGKNKWFFQPLRVRDCLRRYFPLLTDDYFVVLIHMLSVSAYGDEDSKTFTCIQHVRLHP